MSAQGVDRHLLGLRKIAAEEGITEGLEIFQDVGWTRSTHMRLSTSQVSPTVLYAGFTSAAKPDSIFSSFILTHLKGPIPMARTCSCTERKIFGQK